MLLCSFTEKKKQQQQQLAVRVFPAFYHATFHHTLSRAVMYPERGTIDRFHMTSRGPYFCTKQWAMFVYKQNPVGMNSFHMLKPSFIPSNLQSC